MNKTLRRVAGMLLLALPIGLVWAQYQVNMQVNTGIYAGPGPTSVRYAGTYSGANNVYNISSRSADTRVGYATTGVYAPSGMINGVSPANQGYARIPNQAGGGGGPGQVNGQVNSGMVNAQVNAQVSGRVN